MTILYYLGTLLVKLLLRLLTRREVKGSDNVPVEGPLIVVANHLSMADPPVLSASLRRRIVYMAKEESFRSPIQGPLVRGYRAFPVRRGQLDRRALRSAQQVLSEGLALGMFPEGTRSRAGQLQQGHPGTALIALRSGAPLLPVGLTGTEKVLGPRLLFGRVRIAVRVGKPFSLPPVDGRLTKAALAGATEVIMAHVAELLPEDYKGVYGNREGC
jgi:1-acyl-sn-glycerol-3-phosphate acyltransferase